MPSKRNLAEAVAALRELILAGEHYRLQAAAYLGLSVSESQAVSYLLARGAMGQTDLAAALGFNTSSTTSLIDRLERRGIAGRVPDPVDRRRSNVQLTESGVQQLGDVRHWMSAVFSEIAATELPELTTHLNTIATALAGLPSEPPPTQATPARKKGTTGDHS